MENFTLIDLYQTSSKNEEESFKKKSGVEFTCKN